MLEFFNKYNGNVKFSQNGEELLLCECLSRMGITQGMAVEFGGSDGLFCSNTALLLENGWSGLFVEADWNLYLRCRENWKHNARVRSQCSRIDPQNINAFVTDECDVLSIDLDGPDYEVFKGLTAKPRIVIIEIDSSIPPDEFAFNADGAAGYLPMLNLAIEKGYFLLVHTGNLVLVANKYRELFPEVIGDGVANYQDYFRRDWLKVAA